MRLSSNNLLFMERLVSEIITQGLQFPVGNADANAMLLIALYMCQDPTSHVEMREMLRLKDSVILEVWDKYVRVVVHSNEAMCEMADDQLESYLRRLRDES